MFLLRQGERSETWSPKNAMQSPKFDLAVRNYPTSPKFIKNSCTLFSVKDDTFRGIVIILCTATYFNTSR